MSLLKIILNFVPSPFVRDACNGKVNRTKKGEKKKKKFNVKKDAWCCNRTWEGLQVNQLAV